MTKRNASTSLEADSPLPMITDLVRPLSTVRPRPRPEANRSPGRPPAGDSTETRRRILAAACTCFARSGYERTTNADIATLAEVSPGTLYHYFDSKPALFVAVGEYVGRTVFERYLDALSQVSSIDGRLAAIVETFSTLVHEDPTLASLIASWSIEIKRNAEVLELVGPDHLAQSIAFYEALARTGNERGELAPDIEPRAVAGLIVALLFGLSMLVQVGPDDQFPILAAEASTHLFAGTLFGTRQHRSPQRKTGDR